MGVEKDVNKGMEYLKYAVEKYNSELAANERKNYNNMSFKALSYGIFRIFFDELIQLNNRSKRRFERLEHEKSKQAKKEYVLHKD